MADTEGVNQGDTTMINLHNVTAISATEISEISDGRFVRTIVIKDEQHGRVSIDLYAGSHDALYMPADETSDHWRTQSAEESARADAAESELARLRQAIDRIAQGVEL
jgi:uncharacterized protein YceH (UPF0502 family)